MQNNEQEVVGTLTVNEHFEYRFSLPEDVNGYFTDAKYIKFIEKIGVGEHDLYLHPKLIPDNELRDLVNELTKVAKDCAHTQQLRARISTVVLDRLAKYRKNHRTEVEIGNSGK